MIQSHQNKSHQNKYLETTIQTATPAQLLIMLCDGAIRFCRVAIDRLKQKDMQDAHNHIVKVQNIVKEFVITLDQNAAISEHLLKLYDYFEYLLIQANMKKEQAPLEELIGYLLELKETWMEAYKQIQHTSSGVRHG